MSLLPVGITTSLCKECVLMWRQDHGCTSCQPLLTKPPMKQPQCRSGAVLPAAVRLIVAASGRDSEGASYRGAQTTCRPALMSKNKEPPMSTLHQDGLEALCKLASSSGETFKKVIKKPARQP